MKTTTGTIKRRIIAVALAAITLSSFGVMSLTTVSAATDNSALSAAVNANTARAMANYTNNISGTKTAYSILKSGLGTAISVLSKSNPFTAIIASSIIGGLSSIFESGSEGPTTQDIMDTLKQLSNQIESEHETEMTAINKGFLEQNIDSYLENYRVLKGANKKLLAAISNVEDIDNCSKELCEKIMIMTIQYSDFNASFDKMTSYFTPDGTSSKSIIDKYIEYLKLTTTDSAVIRENAEKFVNLVAGQYVLACCVKLTGYAAEIRNVKLQNKVNDSDSQEVIDAKNKAVKDITESNQGSVDSLIETDLKPVLNAVQKFTDSLDSVDSATINNTHYHSIVDAWAYAVNSSGKVTIKLNKDIKADDFANITHITTNTSSYIQNGALYLNNNNSEITIDLNGHTLLNSKGEAIIVKSCKSLKITSTAGEKGTLGGIKAEGDSSNGSSIEISNAVIKGGSKTGVYADASVKTLTLNNCLIQNYTESAIKLNNTSRNEQRYAYVNNCVFENNSGTNGGAIYNYSFIVSADGSRFTNNKATGDGGAVYFKGYYHSLDDSHSMVIGGMGLKNSTFENNAGSNGGAVYIGTDNDYGEIDNCTFTNNTAYSHGGAILSTSKAKINSSSFKYNHASSDGGAVCFKTDTSASIRNSDFYNNSCGSDGGAISVWAHTDADIYNCEIKNNTCGGKGGGLYFGALSSPCTQHQLNTVTITGNTCGNEGGGIYCNASAFSAADVNLYRTVIIKDNKKSDGSSSNAKMICDSCKKAVFYVRDNFDINNSCIYVTSNSNNTAVVSLSSGKSESYAEQANPFHADHGSLKRGTFYNGTIYYYD